MVPLSTGPPLAHSSWQVRQLETDAQKDTARASAGIELDKLVQVFGLLTSWWVGGKGFGTLAHCYLGSADIRR